MHLRKVRCRSRQLYLKQGLVGRWEYKLSGSAPHNGITRHNTNKAKVQAHSLQKDTQGAHPVHLTPFDFFVSVPISPPAFFFLSLAQRHNAAFRQATHYLIYFSIKHKSLDNNVRNVHTFHSFQVWDASYLWPMPSFVDDDNKFLKL